MSALAVVEEITKVFWAILWGVVVEEEIAINDVALPEVEDDSKVDS